MAYTENGDKTWDCQQVDVAVPESGDFSTYTFKRHSEKQQFTSVTDWKYTGSRDDFTWG